MDQQRHRPVLVEFWEMTMPQSMRTLPYLKAWHERYSGDGLRVVAAHTPASAETESDEVVEAAVARLGIEFPVLNDNEGELWSFCGATGYPTRYLWDGDFRLHDLQIGEGEY
ncbi:MAG: DipZ protein, partial [Actinomycetes bacterium]